MYNFLMLLSSGRTEEPANFLAAPAPDIFSNRLRLLFFFQVTLEPKKATPAPKLPDTDFRLFATPAQLLFLSVQLRLLFITSGSGKG